MSVIMFQRRFAPMIIDGSKPHTIRPTRKRPIKVGAHLSLRCWKGKPYRSKQEQLKEVDCTGISSITITDRHVIAESPSLHFMDVDDFARHDGFRDFSEMREWFKTTHGLPFTGTLIEWKP